MARDLGIGIRESGAGRTTGGTRVPPVPRGELGSGQACPGRLAGASGHRGTTSHRGDDRGGAGDGADRRFAPSSRPKRGLDAQGQVVWGVVRRLILAATSGWNLQTSCNRDRLAREVGYSVGTINRWMSPGDDLVPPVTVLHLLLSREDLVDEATRTECVAALCREWGLLVTPAASVAQSGAELRVASLGLASEAGLVAHAVTDATAEHSDGGAVITSGEREVVRLAAARAERAARVVGASVQS